MNDGSLSKYIKMHELSIATNIIEFAEEFAKEHQVKKLKRIELEIGQLSGIVLDSLKFALDFAVKNTVLEQAEIGITVIPGKAICNKCQTPFDIVHWSTVCPACQSMDFEILDGKEMQITSVFID
jgi:hydrogenase nickel incorporation protein HypA/HybF